MKEYLLKILEKELSSGPGYLEKDQVLTLIEKLKKNTLSDHDRRLIADHVLANYLDIHENSIQENSIEKAIDWVLSSERHPDK